MIGNYFSFPTAILRETAARDGFFWPFHPIVITNKNFDVFSFGSNLLSILGEYAKNFYQFLTAL
jgi:hypothetical protein